MTEKDNNTGILLSKVHTTALFDELTRRDPEDLRIAVYSLLRHKKLSYTDLSKLYVKSLEVEKDDTKWKLGEASTCILAHVMHQDQKGQTEHTMEGIKRKDTFRSLYFLDKIWPAFKVDDLKKKYNYNEDEANDLSEYGRNHIYNE